MKVFLGMAMVLTLAGCDGDSSGTACTEEARSSVVLKIQDADTNEILDSATVEFSVDGGMSETLVCDSDEMGLNYCGSLVLAYEVDGVFEFTVSSAGYEDLNDTVTVEKDECHVIGETLTINMISL